MSEGSSVGGERWVSEEQQQFLRVAYRVRRGLFCRRSALQEVKVVETAGFGRMLLLDSVVQVSERDEQVYHEMIAHVPLFVHANPVRVLVVGGGDGGTVREVLRHPSVEFCRLVEIDPIVIEACREHFPWTAPVLDDSRCALTIGDGVEFVRESTEAFDVIIVDSSDPQGPAASLFGDAFYRDVRRRLTADGIVVSQAGSPFYDADVQASLVGVLGGVFPRVHLYNYSNLVYPGGLWSFTYASVGDRCPIAGLRTGSVEALEPGLSYYGEAVHRAAFVPPAFQARALRGLVTPLPAGRSAG